MFRDRIRPWWNLWTKVGLLILAVLVYAAIQPDLIEIAQDLPTLAQQAIGLLILAAILGFIIRDHRQNPHPYNVFLAGGFIAIALAIGGVWSDITAPLAIVFFVAAVISLPVWDFVQYRRAA